MHNREKVIKELETEIQDFSPACTSDERLKETMEMTLELLKGQEDGTMFIYDDYYTPMCQKCGFHPFVGYIPTIEWMKEKGYKVCPHCGRAVNWNG